MIYELEEPFLEAKEPEGKTASNERYGLDGTILNELLYLRPIPKPCFNWYVDKVLMETSVQFVQQIGRITGSLGITHIHTDDEMTAIDALARTVQATVTLVLFPLNGHLEDTWEAYMKDIAFQEEVCKRVKANGIKVGAVTLDSEHFHVQSPKTTGLLDLVFAVVREQFPTVPIIWYKNGEWHLFHDVNCENCRTSVLYGLHDPKQTEERLDEAYSTFPDAHWGIWTTIGPGYANNKWTWKNPFMKDRNYYDAGRWMMADDRIKYIMPYPFILRPVTLVESVHAFIAWVKGMNGMLFE